MFHYAYKTILVLTFFTDIVTAACPENCNSCDERDRCISCKTGKWDLNNRCQQLCNANCLNNECHAGNGYCVSCKFGFYGIQCQHSCSQCEDEQCDLRFCTKGCKLGYYEYKTDAETLCWSCSADCKSCINNIVCSVCNDGYYLYKYDANGRILVQCIQCQQGTVCSNYCSIQNCDQCQVLGDSLFCTQCIARYRFNGDICIPNDSNCSQGCSTDCDEDGMCLGDCNLGWTGEQCSDPCSGWCLKCNKNNANSCQECKDDYYTITCNVKCSPACIKMSGKQTCRFTDGYCLNGCESNLWGQFCNQSCSNGCADDGVSRVCDRHNGTCKSGCTEGYTGDKCETAVTKKSTTQYEAEASKTERSLQTEKHVTPTTRITTQSVTSLQCQCEVNCDKDAHFAIGYVSGLGTAAFIVAVTATLYHIRRRYISRKSKTSEDCTVTTDMPTYYNETAAQTPASERTDNDASNYESLGSNRNTDKVYSELERSETEQSHKYYNIDIPKQT